MFQDTPIEPVDPITPGPGMGEDPSLASQAEDLAARLARANRLLAALGQVTAKAQTAEDPQAVLETFGAELSKLGWLCFVARWDPAAEIFRVEYFSLTPRLIRAAERLTGLQLQGYPLTRRIMPDTFAAVVDRGEPHLIRRPGAIATQILTDFGERALRVLLRLIGLDPERSQVRVLHLPLIVQGRLVGMLGIWGPDLTEADMGPAQIFAAQVAGVLERARRDQEERQRIAFEREVLARLGRQLLGKTERKAILQALLETLHAMVPTRSLAVWGPQPAGGWQPEEVWGAEEETWPPFSLLEMVAQAAEEGQSLIRAAEAEEGTPYTWIVWPIPGRAGCQAVLTLEMAGSPPDEAQLHPLHLATTLAAQALEQVRLMAALQVSERRYRGLFEDVPVGIFVTSPDDRILDVNPALLEMFGLPDRETALAMRPSWFWADPEEREAWQARLARDWEVEHCEVRMRRYDGREIWVRSDARAVKDAQGQVRYYTGSMMDITARREWELAEAARRERLERQQHTVHALITDPAVAEGRLDEALPRIVSQVGRCLEVARANLWLLDRSGRMLRCVASWDRGRVNQEVGQVLRLEEAPGYAAALAEGKVVAAVNVHTDPRTAELSQGYWAPLGIASSMEAPIRRGDQVLGVLHLEHVGQPRVWEPDEMTFAARSGELVLRTLLNAEIRRRIRELEQLTRLTQALRLCSRVDEMIPVLLAAATEAGGGNRATLYLQDPGSGDLVLRGWHPDSFPMPPIRLRPGEGITGHVFVEGRVRVTEDVHRDPLARLFPGQEAFLEGVRSAVALPLRFQEQVMGVMHITYAAEQGPDEDTIRLLEAVAEIAGHALHRAVLLEALEQQVAERTQGLVEALERIQAILASVGEGVMVIDPTGHIQQVNPAFEDYSGFPAQRVVGRHVSAIMPWVQDEGQIEKILQALAAGRPWQGEIQGRRHSGALIDASVIVAPVRRGDELMGYVATIRDITAQKELERMKDRFIQDVSHELRTPLANVRLYLDLLTRYAEEPERRARYLSMLRSQAQLLTQLVESVLEISRLEAGAIQTERSPQDLNQVVRQVLADLADQAQAKGLGLAAELADGLPPVEATETELHRVVVNLVSNAIRYTDAGQVTVRTRAVDGWVELEVADTGMGIHPEDLPHLFERFYRGRGASQSAIPGSGLGLGIVKAVVDGLGGQIQVESQVGKGSVFRVRLVAKT